MLCPDQGYIFLTCMLRLIFFFCKLAWIWFTSFVRCLNKWVVPSCKGDKRRQYYFSICFLRIFCLKRKKFFTNQPQTWSKQEIMIRSNCFCYTGSFWYIVTNVIIWGLILYFLLVTNTFNFRIPVFLTNLHLILNDQDN